MAKTFSTALDAHLQGEVTTLARCWYIKRTDGTEFFFTDHDQDIVFDGNTYLSSQGFSSTAVANNASLDVDNLDVSGFFDNDAIKNEDMDAGLFDYAEVRLFIVNWNDLTMLDGKLRRGFLGEVRKSPNGYFETELRGMTQVLAQNIGELYGPECRADLGDSRCKLPLNPDVIARNTAYTVGQYVRVATGAGSGQAAYENRIYLCTQAGTTAGVQPTYDTTVGNSTTDGGGVAGTLTLTGNANNSETVVIDDKTYTFQTVLTDVDGHVLIGATAADSISNLVAAIMLGSGAGTAYATSTTVHPTVTAAVGTGTSMDVTIKDGVTVPGTSIKTSETMANASWGASTLSGAALAAVFQAVEAWSRDFEVATVPTDRRVFTITVTEARAVDGWYDGGVVVFETGPNEGRAFEVKSWVQSTSQAALFLPTGFSITVGETGRIYPGCDKRLATCRDIFDNLLNMRAEPYLPGNDAAFATVDAGG